MQEYKEKDVLNEEGITSMTLNRWYKSGELKKRGWIKIKNPNGSVRYYRKDDVEVSDTDSLSDLDRKEKISRIRLNDQKLYEVQMEQKKQNLVEFMDIVYNFLLPVREAIIQCKLNQEQTRMIEDGMNSALTECERYINTLSQEKQSLRENGLNQPLS